MKITSPLFKLLAGIIVLGLTGFGIWKLQTPQEEETPSEETLPVTTKEQTTNTTTVSEEKPVAPTQVESSTAYKDGTYTLNTTYRTPERSEPMGVSITLKDDIIVAANITIEAHDQQSKKYQSLFSSGFTKKVIGQPIDGLSLAVVNGASLTTRSFNEALLTIKKQAAS